MSTPLDTILRLGCSAEVADVYQAVGRFVECTDPYKRNQLLDDIEVCYRECEQAHADAIQDLDRFREADGTPAVIRHKWKPDQ